MEQWKDICFTEKGVLYDYTGLYAVSSEGNVKSLGNDKTRKEKILKTVKNKYGYQIVGLHKDGKEKKFRVNRLVAHMFLDGYFDGLVVDHINTIRTDNRSINLRWVTHKENCNNPLTKQKIRKAQGKKVIGYSLTDTKVIVFKSTKQAEKFGFSSGAICACCNGKYCEGHEYKGYRWCYLDDIKNNKLEKED